MSLGGELVDFRKFIKFTKFILEQFRVSKAVRKFPETIWQFTCATNKILSQNVHDVHSAFSFIGLRHERCSFRDVHDVHDVHDVRWAIWLSKNIPIAGWPVGQAILHQKIACIALIPHFLIPCQTKQGAVVDVVWNQRCGFWSVGRFSEKARKQPVFLLHEAEK